MSYRVYQQHKILWLVLTIVAASFAATAARAEDGKPKFFRAINLNGPELEIDGHLWEADGDYIVAKNANAFEDQKVPLVPPTDDARAKMIRNSRWGTEFSIELHDLPASVYQVFLYCWEDNVTEKFSINLNRRTVVLEYDSGKAGQWKRLGPWRTVVRDGILQLSGEGGAANFSGIEIWEGDGAVPDPMEQQFASNLTEDQVAFFESRIRPLLIDHCYDCHSVNADEPRGGLLLDSRAGVVRGGINGRVVWPGSPEHSPMIKAIHHEDADLAMPPDGKLTDEQIADLEKWVRMKAPDPRTEDTIAELKKRSDLQLDKALDFWSLKPVAKPPMPIVKATEWASSDLDRFVLAKMEAAGLAPSPDASKRTMIRRASYDLIGLPPSPEDVDAFVADESPTAYANLIERLLSSPQYGERWGRRWLDVVRYSDTAGDNSDFPIPQMYHYRNWVIEAFNRDLPYDQFVSEQLAGDLMGGSSAEETKSRLIATGYIANARRFGSRNNDYPQHLTIEDTIDNLGRAFLATTINCARCHNHKFDPISTEDYYAIYGIFHSTRYPWPGIELEQRQRDLVALENDSESVKQLVANREKQYWELKKAADTAKEKYEKTKDVEESVRKELESDWKEKKKTFSDFQSQPLPIELFYAVTEAKQIEDVAVQIKGDPSKPGSVVPRHFLTILGGKELAADDQSSGRLQLAKWIADKDNPLTARVIVNRIWSWHFGRGLAPTPNDFGRQGKPPTHPELLDYLADEFIKSGWSIKDLHRKIMLSRSYQLSSILEPVALETDPSNVWLSAFPRQRLDAEAIRDTFLLLSGSLDLNPGGEHPFPPQGQWEFTQHNPFKAIYSTNHRSVYLMTQRIQRHPYLAIFDGADPSTSTPQRLTSTTPLQSLYLLNDKFVHDAADGLTNRVLAHDQDEEQRMNYLWKMLFSRELQPSESEAVTKAMNSIRVEYQKAGLDVQKIEKSVWASTIRSLFRLNEFVYID